METENLKELFDDIYEAKYQNHKGTQTEPRQKNVSTQKDQDRQIEPSSLLQKRSPVPNRKRKRVEFAETKIIDKQLTLEPSPTKRVRTNN